MFTLFFNLAMVCAVYSKLKLNLLAKNKHYKKICLSIHTHLTLAQIKDGCEKGDSFINIFVVVRSKHVNIENLQTKYFHFIHLASCVANQQQTCLLSAGTVPPSASHCRECQDSVNKIMAEAGDGNFSNSQPKCSPTAITDAPITDPGSSIKVR